MLGIFLLFLGIFTWHNYINNKAADIENLSNSFNGIVQKVEYNVKGMPSVMVHDKQYHLIGGYNFEYKISKGDSLIKRKNSTVYKLIKKGTDSVFLFEN
ncbi:hypothetical protein [Mucilaginibacter sp. KACC 22063]|uniref:hypothetical protein n=1 Tax=Mucilaginibacter sp. KACC 22063 TaxID=3025666 RepID=UPI0023668C8C|nr:hypothetical protein [Mucilaginibacter sp. KACC 22063]WDF56536.1 hypothetical protein PQ461_05665 [Mucilaginibacter sp. KACC 22063]